MSDPNLPKLFLWRVKIDAFRPCAVVASCAEEAIRTAKEVFAEWTGEQSFVMECCMMQGVDAVSRQQMSDKKIDELLEAINDEALEIDDEQFGLPLGSGDNPYGTSLRRIVRDWLADLNQPPSTSN